MACIRAGLFAAAAKEMRQIPRNCQATAQCESEAVSVPAVSEKWPWAESRKAYVVDIFREGNSNDDLDA